MAEAAQGGGVKGAAAAARMSVVDLRSRVDELRQQCEELRARKVTRGRLSSLFTFTFITFVIFFSFPAHTR